MMGLSFAWMYVVFCLLMRFITGSWAWFRVLIGYAIVWLLAMFLDVLDYSGAITGGGHRFAGRFFGDFLFDVLSGFVVFFVGGLTLAVAVVWRIVQEIKKRTGPPKTESLA